MSLFKQLLICIGLFLIIAFAGSFVVSLETSRGQQVSQLQSHAQDAATALSLSLQPNIEDPAMVELLVSSIFDSGYFERIRVVDLQNDGKVLVERNSPKGVPDVPDWFSRLVDIQPQPGEAVVMRGWTQAARIEVISHPRFAIARLWQAALGSLFWLLGCGLVSAVIGALLLRSQLRPLEYMVDQSQAIARRQFLSLSNLPRTPELRRVVEAMNMMVEKLKALFQEQAERSEQLRDEAYLDSLTGLANRRRFDIALQTSLSSEEQTAFGYLLMLRVNDLIGLNQRRGGVATDQLLVSVAETVRRVAAPVLSAEGLLARSRGGEFAILAPGLLREEAINLATELDRALHNLYVTQETDQPRVAHIGVAPYSTGDAPKSLLHQIDQALAQAQSQASPNWSLNERAGLPVIATERNMWHDLLDRALEEGRFILYFQPVKSLENGNDILHHKVLARVLDNEGTTIAAGRFLPWIERFGWGARLDQVMLELVLTQMGTHEAKLAFNLSNATVRDESALAGILDRLRYRPELGPRLILELNEAQLPARHVLENLARRLRDLGYSLAMQHFGGRFSMIGNLARLGLAYLKIDGSYIRNIDQEDDKRLFIDAVQRAANSIDLPLIAERVETAGELEVLRGMGIAGAVGQYLGEPAPWV